MKKILFIEDEPKINKYTEKFFTMAGFEVYCVEQGYKGIDLFKEKHPDVVFIDKGLPDVDGTVVLKTIRTLDSNVPIALLTGDFEETLKKEIGGSGANAFFGKPCMFNELLDWIRKVSP